MPTRILFVNHSVPHCFHGGGGVCYSMVWLFYRLILIHLLCLESSDLMETLRKIFMKSFKKDLCVEVYFADRK